MEFVMGSPKLNPRLSWKRKKGVIVVYDRFDFIFFRNETEKWLGSLIKNNKKDVPLDFIEFLEGRNIIA